MGTTDCLENKEREVYVQSHICGLIDSIYNEFCLRTGRDSRQGGVSGLLGKEQSEMAAGLMFKNIDGALYLQVNPRFDFRTGPIGFGIQVS